MNPDPHQPHLVLVACESDNKIFILDMNQGEILKQFSGRFFVTDVRSFLFTWILNEHVYLLFRNMQPHVSARKVPLLFADRCHKPLRLYHDHPPINQDTTHIVGPRPTLYIGLI